MFDSAVLLIYCVLHFESAQLYYYQMMNTSGGGGGGREGRGKIAIELIQQTYIIDSKQIRSAVLR